MTAATPRSAAEWADAFRTFTNAATRAWENDQQILVVTVPGDLSLEDYNALRRQLRAVVESYTR